MLRTAACGPVAITFVGVGCSEDDAGLTDADGAPTTSSTDSAPTDSAPDEVVLATDIPVARTPPGAAVPETDRALQNVQRIEQCGDRVTITSGGIIHDMRSDGTEENGVDDIAERDLSTPIQAVATFENGVHVLRPVGLPVEVTRRLDGDRLIWNYLGTVITLERVGDPGDPPPMTEAGP